MPPAGAQDARGRVKGRSPRTPPLLAPVFPRRRTEPARPAAAGTAPVPGCFPSPRAPCHTSGGGFEGKLSAGGAIGDLTIKGKGKAAEAELEERNVAPARRC